MYRSISSVAGAAIGDHAAQAHLVVLRLGVDRRDDAVHGENRVEIIGRDDQRAIGMLQRRSKAAADDVAEHVEDDDVGIFEQLCSFSSLTVWPTT